MLDGLRPSVGQGKKGLHNFISHTNWDRPCVHLPPPFWNKRPKLPHLTTTPSGVKLSPHQHQRMQASTYIKTGSTPTFQDLKLNTKGKSPNLYQCVAFISIVDRKYHIINLPQQQTKKLEHPPLLSPHTRVCGKRWVYKPNKTLNKKKKLKNRSANMITNLTTRMGVLTKLHINQIALTCPNTYKQNNKKTKKNTKHNIQKNPTHILLRNY